MKTYKFTAICDESNNFVYITEADSIEKAEENAEVDLIGDSYNSLRLDSITKGKVSRTPYMNFSIHL